MKNLISLLFTLLLFIACSNLDSHIGNINRCIDVGNLRSANTMLLNIPINLIDDEGKAKVYAIESRLDSIRNIELIKNNI